MAIVTFTCALCQKEITEDHDDELALAQLQRDYPETSSKMLAKHGADWQKHVRQVCTGCYDIIKDTMGEKKGATLQ